MTRALVAGTGLGELPGKMAAVAAGLDTLMALAGPSLIQTLNRIGELIPLNFAGHPKQALSQIFIAEASNLRLLALLLRALVDAAALTAADRKLAATRALAWLFHGGQAMLNVSDNETYKQLADLLEVARDASVTATTSPNELQIRLRIRRYKLARRQEFDSMKRYWNTKQVSPKLPELILMIVFGLVPRKFPSE